MKWLLITTATRTPDTLDSNVGDEFARMGIQKVIQEVDKEATFDLLDKENAGAWTPRPFDKAIVCGMPLFWSLPSTTFPGRQTAHEVWWWPRIMRGWPSAYREHFLVWGVGHVFVDRILSLHDYVSDIEETLNRAWKVIVREPVLDHPRIVDSICPSAFCMLHRQAKREVSLCNLMPDGGHFGYLSEDSKNWIAKAKDLAGYLRKAGFYFIAHTKEEAKFASSLGWTTDMIKLPNTAEGYFDWYSRASCYVGNRLHGAAVCASSGTPTWAVSWDSRLGMVRRLGGKATLPSEISPAAIDAWLNGKIVSTPTPFVVRTEYSKMVNLVTEFSKAVALPPWTD